MSIRFSKRCRDLNREYEENNNADLDNGVYNAFVNEQEMEAERQQQEELMLAAKKEEENKLNNSLCTPEPIKDDDKDKGQSQNVVLNLGGLEKELNPKNRGDIFKIEENRSLDMKNSFNSSTDSEDDDLS